MAIKARRVDSAQKTIKGPKGQKLSWRKAVDYVASTPYPRVMPPTTEEMKDVMEMSDRYLAEAYRPVVLTGGHEYVGEAPKDLKASLRKANAPRQTKPMSPLLRAKDERAGNG